MRLVLALILVSAGAARAAGPLDAYLAQVASQPVEIAADILFRVDDASLLKTPEQRRAWLEPLFNRALQATEPVPLHSLARNPDTRSAFRAANLRGMRHDALSIQLSVVRRLLADQPPLARQLFEQIQLPKTANAPAVCTDSVLPDLSLFHATATEIANRAFTPLERRKEEPVRFLERHIVNTLATSASLEPMLRMIRAANLPPRQQSQLLRLFAARLSNLQDTDRSFSWFAAQPALARILWERRPQLDPDIEPALAAAFRQYLDRHLNGPRCADNLADTEATASLAASFNSRRGELEELAVDKFKATEVPNRAEPGEYWKSESASALRDQVRKLLTGGAPRVLTPEERASATWEEQASQVLAALASFPEQEDDDLFQRLSVLRQLIGYSPKPRLLETAVSQYVALLARPGFREARPLAWISHLNALVEMAREPDATGAELIRQRLATGSQLPLLGAAERVRVVELVQQSQEANILLYCQAAALGARPGDKLSE